MTPCKNQQSKLVPVPIKFRAATHRAATHRAAAHINWMDAKLMVCIRVIPGSVVVFMTIVFRKLLNNV